MLRREIRSMFRLALPLAAAQAGTQLMGVVDIAVLGRYGAQELAASGLANALFFSVSIVGMGMVFGIDPMISQSLGAGDRVRARRVLWQGVWLALLVTLTLTVPLLAAAALIPRIGVERALIGPATEFLVIRTLSLGPLLLFLVCRAYLQALGRTRPMIVAMVSANIVNFLADLLFVFGGTILPEWCGPLRAIPAFGAAGAAASTLMASILEVAIVAVAVRRSDVEHVRGINVRRWNRPQVLQAFHVGWPVALQMGAEVGIFALVALMAARLGTIPLAAHQVVIGLASFTYTASLGVAAAGSVRVGLAVGARAAGATRSAGHAAFIGGATLMGVSALVFALAPRPLARLITNDASVIAVAVPLFLVAAYFQLSDGLQAVGSGVLRGAGDTRFAFLANLVGHWCVGLPVALWLGFSRKMGIVGLWWGLCAGLTVVAAMLIARFERLSSASIEPLATTSAD